MVAEIVGRQPDDAFEHGLAQFGDDVVRYPAHGVVADEAEQRPNDEEGEDAQRIKQPVQTVGGTRKSPVEQAFHDRRKYRLDNRGQSHAGDGCDESEPVGTDVAEQAEVKSPAVKRRGSI